MQSSLNFLPQKNFCIKYDYNTIYQTHIISGKFFQRQHDYIIIGHPLLRHPHWDIATLLKLMRNIGHLPEGGSFDTLVVNIQQLYDQFNYGEPSPLAIYQFSQISDKYKSAKIFVAGW